MSEAPFEERVTPEAQPLLVKDLVESAVLWDAVSREVGLLRQVYPATVTTVLLAASELREALAPDESPVLLLLRIVAGAEDSSIEHMWKTVAAAPMLRRLRVRLYPPIQGRPLEHLLPPFFKMPATKEQTGKLVQRMVLGGSEELKQADSNVLQVYVRVDHRHAHCPPVAVALQAYPAVRGLTRAYLKGERGELPMDLGGLPLVVAQL